MRWRRAYGASASANRNSGSSSSTIPSAMISIVSRSERSRGTLRPCRRTISRISPITLRSETSPMLRPKWRARKLRQVLAQAGSIDDSGRGAEREQSVCQPSWVLTEKPAQEAAELLAQAVVEVADHPEVHDSDPPGRLDEEVARDAGRRGRTRPRKSSWR